MWKRSDLKNSAKTAFYGNYWKAVLVGLILMIVAGGFGGFGSGFGQTLGMNNNNHKYLDSYNDDGDFQIYPDSFKTETETATETAAAIVVIVLVVILVTLVVMAVVLTLSAFLINPLKVGISRFFVQNLDNKSFIKEIGYGFDHNYKNIVKTMILRDIFNILWYLLLIIPGIIKAYEYSMIVYIMGDNPEIDRKEAFALSKKMMDGQKWRAFVLDLSFIGWRILGFMTCGILNIFYVTPYQSHTTAALYVTLKGNLSDSDQNEQTLIEEI